MNAQPIFHFKKMLENLERCMDKTTAYADRKKIDPTVIAQSRLAVDMFPFVKQVQSVCDSAKFAAAYLSGKTAPKHEDNEETWDQARARIKKVTAYLGDFKDGDFKDAMTQQVKPGWAEGKWMSGEDYLNQIAIPNFYFHLNMAYAIMRHCGADVGKMDYLGTVDLKA